MHYRNKQQHNKNTQCLVPERYCKKFRESHYLEEGVLVTTSVLPPDRETDIGFGISAKNCVEPVGRIDVLQMLARKIVWNLLVKSESNNVEPAGQISVRFSIASCLP